METKTCGCTLETCGCCAGTQTWTPAATANRPGLSALHYRVGTHGAFFETMKARLAGMQFEAPGVDNQTLQTFRPLDGLTTRASSDPAIALLDGWATLGDVLTFYQERIANEGYLRTATERRSVLELARLVGYALRPGVASTVYLAYTLEDRQTDPVEIPLGARSQSIPGPGELPQSFETSEKLLARREWNNLQVRVKRPQNITLSSASNLNELYVAGTNTNLKTGDKLLFVFNARASSYVVRTVAQIEGQFEDKRTRIRLLPEESNRSIAAAPTDPSKFVETKFVEQLLQEPIPQARNSQQFNRSLGSAAKKGSDIQPQLLVNFAPRLRDTFYTAWSNANVNDTAPALQAVYALRVAASLFGANAARPPSFYTVTDTNHRACEMKPQKDWDDGPLDIMGETSAGLFLDQVNEAILPGGYVVIPTQTTVGTAPHVLKVKKAQTTSRTAYGISGKTTQLTFNADWWKPGTDNMATLRSALVYAQSEELTLIEEPITAKVQEQNIELAVLYKELTSGRWVVLSGERADIPNVVGVKVSELLMIAGLKHDYDPNLPGDQIHTTLLLATPLAYHYKRDTLKIYANVVKATHGETRNEVLGSGDGSQALQSFGLKQPPLTFVPAPNPAGVDSTLKVYVNDVEWHETDTLAGLESKDRNFVTKADDDSKTTVIFGNGKQGARLPTGVENVRAVYRNGIGKGGNVLAEQISLLMTRPLGVKEVINPLRASGGADKESRDQARDNASLGVMALDRLVSVQDYSDFTRTFAGIAKAQARRLSNGKRELLHLTIAGADDVPIDPVSDVYRNLLLALRQFGDPDLPLQVDSRELKVLVLSAKVRLAPDYQWEPVVTQIRAALLDAFGFQKRSLGQPVLLSEVVSLIQNIEGVEYVDVDTFGGIPEKRVDVSDPKRPLRRLLTLDEIASAMATIVDPANESCAKNGVCGVPMPAPRVDVNQVDFEKRGGTLQPAQLAIFSPTVPDTLILNQIT